MSQFAFFPSATAQATLVSAGTSLSLSLPVDAGTTPNVSPNHTSEIHDTSTTIVVNNQMSHLGFESSQLERTSSVIE